MRFKEALRVMVPLLRDPHLLLLPLLPPLLPPHLYRLPPAMDHANHLVPCR
jgi:hypothetical protein